MSGVPVGYSHLLASNPILAAMEQATSRPIAPSPPPHTNNIQQQANHTNNNNSNNANSNISNMAPVKPSPHAVVDLVSAPSSNEVNSNSNSNSNLNPSSSSSISSFANAPPTSSTTAPSASLSANNSSTHPPTITTNFTDAGDSAHLIDDERIEKVVLAYLQRRGFKHTKEALLEEKKKQSSSTSSTSIQLQPNGTTIVHPPPGSQDIHTFAADISLDQHTHLLKQVLNYSIMESTPDTYTQSFENMKRWMMECLEIYRPELFACLWPIYAHVFIQLIHRGFPHDAHRFLSKYRHEHEMLHKSELLAFQNLTTDSDLQKCDIVRWFIQRKVEVTMSSFAHQLLITYLEEHNYLLLLKIVNEHIHIKIMSRRPLPLEGDMTSSSTSGPSGGIFNSLNPLAIQQINTTPIRWGALPEYVTLATEAQVALRSKLRDQQLNAKMARIEAQKAAAAKEKEKEEAAASAAKPDGGDNEESATKKQRTEDGTTKDGDGNANGDVEMTDANEEGANASSTAVDEKSKDSKSTTGGGASKSKAKPKKDGDGTSAVKVDSLKETKEEAAAIDRTVKKTIHVPEAMVLPKKEEQQVKLPPITADARLKFLSDLNFRKKLSPSSLPSVCFYTFLNSLSTVNSIRVSEDGSIVTAGLSDSTVRVYDLRDPTIRQSTNPSSASMKDETNQEMKEAEANDVDMIGQTNILQGSTFINRRLGDEETRLPYTKLVGHSGPVYSTSLSTDGLYVLSASEDCTVRLWNLETKRNLVIYKGHNYPIWDVTFAPLGFYFATASHDHTARLWSTNSVTPVRMFVGHTSDVDVVKFHPNCNYVATGSSDSTARLWDIQTGECVRVFVGPLGTGVRTLAMDPEGRYCATGGSDGKVAIWDLGTGRQVTSYDAHQQPVTSLEYSADGDILASGSADYSIQLWDAKRSHHTQPLRTFHTKRTPVHYLKFTPRNLLLAAGVFNA